MIKLPEPAFKNRHPPNPLPTNYYSEAQLKQAVRDALEEAAKVAGPEDSYQDERFKAKADSAMRIRALLKEIE